jgi:hypothetical protein
VVKSSQRGSVRSSSEESVSRKRWDQDIHRITRNVEQYTALVLTRQVSHPFQDDFRPLFADWSKEGLRQAPKANQPFIPDTAPVRRSHSNAHQSPQPTGAHTYSTGSMGSNMPQGMLENWEGRDQRQVPMSTREVATPGNRPGLFATLHDRGKVAKQPDFYDPYFPLKYLEVPKCTCTVPSNYYRFLVEADY